MRRVANVVALSKLRQSIRCKDCRNRFTGMPGELRCPRCCGVVRTHGLSALKPEPESPFEERPTQDEIRAGCLAAQAKWSPEVRAQRMGLGVKLQVVVIEDWLGEGAV